MLAASLAACAGQAPPPRVPEPAAALTAGPPAWRPGDRWSFEWTSGTQSGSKHAEVLAVREVNTLRYYVVRIGDLDHYFTFDLHWAASVRDSVVQARMIPPHQWFVWPLVVGRQWVHRGMYEEGGDKSPRIYHFAVVSVETVEVPAGRFRALKVVRDEGGAESDEYWYVPEVRWYARWIGRRGDVRFEERLVSWIPAEATVGGGVSPVGPR